MGLGSPKFESKILFSDTPKESILFEEELPNTTEPFGRSLASSFRKMSRIINKDIVFFI